MTKLALDLQPNDVIKPPAGERKWLKTNITITQKLGEGREDKGGKWLLFTADYLSPNTNVKRSFKLKMRPTTQVKLEA